VIVHGLDERADLGIGGRVVLVELHLLMRELPKEALSLGLPMAATLMPAPIASSQSMYASLAYWAPG
jgi:hypothetical protein